MKRDWKSYTITMLESLQVLNDLIVVSWPQDLIRQKIEMLNQARQISIQRILELESTIENGCQWLLHNLPNIA